ncbi:hypothetical protein BZG36_01456 [Bifiguratus adelaidae]|uniref:Bicarbonate transporter-like transmembrane domain-containing protein n=1 Tax=Bifiguratus adelaidae TaxID=1938954 RepID=A0A261Y4Y9_9FUNG|nr:hypothetical protein BZG36_01456 [Bifiguratus adelaidae]
MPGAERSLPQGDDPIQSSSNKPFSGIEEDLRRRLPLYWSDWKDGFTSSRVLSSIVFMFFCQILPAVTFAADLTDSTQRQYGVVEVLLSTGIGGIIFSILAGQPLVIMGVTGPVAVFSATVYEVAQALHLEFLPFMGWSMIWAALFHFIIAIFNVCNTLKYVTRFSCEIFGCLIAVIYIVKGGTEIARNFQTGPLDGALLSLLLALGTLYIATMLGSARRWDLFKKPIRAIISDYAAAAAIVIFTAIPCLPKLSTLSITRLSVPPTFQPTTNRPWLVDLSALPVWAVFAAILPGIVLTVLFYFDHNVSSLLTQAPEFNLRKGPSFHWDFFVLGVCTLISGLIGIPAPNGLIPQAPLHTRSVARITRDPSSNAEIISGAIENRISPFGQALFISLTLIPQILHILGLVPRAVLAGLFLYMGLESFVGNTLAERVALFFRDKNLTPPGLNSAHGIPTKIVFSFTAIQLVALGLIFYITESPAAISFPVFILLLLPLRMWVLPRIMEQRWLESLDDYAVARAGIQVAHADEIEGEDDPGFTQTLSRRRTETSAWCCPSGNGSVTELSTITPRRHTLSRDLRATDSVSREGEIDSDSESAVTVLGDNSKDGDEKAMNASAHSPLHPFANIEPDSSVPTLAVLDQMNSVEVPGVRRRSIAFNSTQRKRSTSNSSEHTRQREVVASGLLETTEGDGENN